MPAYKAKRLIHISCAVLCQLTCLCSLAYSTEVFRDQYYPPSTSWSQAYYARDIAQSFHVTVAGFLDHIDLHVNHQTGVLGSMLWDIRRIVNGLPDESNVATLASGSIPIAKLPVYPTLTPIVLDLAEDNIRVRPGDELAIVIRSTNSGAYWLSHGASKPNHGIKYERFANQTWIIEDFYLERPRAFATYVRLIPEPSTVLLAAGLGLIGICRRHAGR